MGGFKARDDAAEWIVLEKRRLKAEDLVPTAGNFSLLATAYLDDCEGRFRPNTVQVKARTYRDLLAWIGSDISTDDVTRARIKAYLRDQFKKRGPKAANRDLKEIRALFNWARREGQYLAPSPASDIEPYAEQKSPRVIPTSEQMNAVLLAATPEETDMILCLYYTAGRISEVLRMSWDDVNLQARTVRLWTRKRRGGAMESEILEMEDGLHEVLSRRWKHRDEESPFVFTNPRTGDRFTRNQKEIRFMMSGICKRAEVPVFGFHAIRHHVATILMNSGEVGVRALQLFLRHKRVTTTEVYLHDLDVRGKGFGGILDRVRSGGGRTQRSHSKPPKKERGTD
jgi:integrase